MTSLVVTVLAVLAVAGLLLAALTHHHRQENPMCGCQKHNTPTAECTCICPEHRNFDVAYDLAMRRYDEIRALRRALEDRRRDWERAVLQHVLEHAPANRPDGDVTPDWISAVSTAMIETRDGVA